MTKDEIWDAVRLERARQEHLKRDGKFAFTLNDLFVDGVPVTDVMRLPILVEEVGEVARAMNDGKLDDLKAELTQVAALAVAWLESVP